MTRNKLTLLLAATVAAVGIAGSASATQAGGGPSLSDFQLVETDNGLNGVYSVTNNSADWYITSFAVTNSEARDFNAFAQTQQGDWDSGKFCNGSGCGDGSIGLSEGQEFAGNQPVSSGLGVGYGFYYYYDAAAGGLPAIFALGLLLDPGLKNDDQFEFFNVALESEVQFNLVNGLNGDTATLDFPASSGAPEPASWALMIGGFGLAGAALRRRRSTVAA